MSDGRVLPPITSSQMGVEEAAQSVCKGLSINSTQPSKMDEVVVNDISAPASKPVTMTLSDLEKSVGDDESVDEGWNVGEFLKKNVPQVRKTGASLAGAAIKASKDGRSKSI